MEELIYLLIKLIAKGLEGTGSGARRQQEQALQARLAWEQRQAWERRQRELLAGPPVAKPAPPRLPQARPVSRVAPALEVSRTTAEGAGGKAAGSVTGKAVAAAFGQPRTLRDRFVLTEILRPPMALRPPRA